MNRPLNLTKLLRRKFSLCRMENVLTGLIFMKKFARYIFKNLMLEQTEREKIEMADFDYSRVKDVDFFVKTGSDAHSDHRFYASVSEAEDGESSFVYSLNGLWKFSYARN